MKHAIAILALLALAACADPREGGERITHPSYAYDPRTELCFAYPPFGYGITVAPCTPEVKRLAGLEEPKPTQECVQP